MARSVLDPKRLLSPVDLPRWPALLLAASAVAVAVGAYEHAHLFHHDYGTPLIRTLFLLNAIASLATILLLVVRRLLLYLAGALAISVGSIVAIILTHSSHVLGFYEASWTTEAKITIAAEVVAVLLAVAAAVVGREALLSGLGEGEGTPAPLAGRLRALAGVAAVVVLGGAIAGIAQGGPPGSDAPAPTRADRDAAAQRIAALGATARRGRAVFTGDAGCGGCHRLADAGTSSSVGPDLDRALRGADAKEIREDIVAPDAEIAPGFPKGLMPGDFGQRLSPKQLDDLVAYLTAAAGG
ncbi:c-type cytochrome [Patulibacter defluvii]|uniref:c-type cytochrome n=1 Tax=Patulibacter defluvii TaxID=3095358 RepID=UPI002A750DE8|nr:cytochrome c [Patulibacter sp. DM4]